MVTSYLKDHAHANQAEPLAVLDEKQRAGNVSRIKSLWLANAIAFTGDQVAVDALATLEMKGVLIHDKSHDMISPVMSSKEPLATDGGDPVEFSQAKDDTVWGVKWIYANDVWNSLGYNGDGIIVAHFDTGGKGSGLPGAGMSGTLALRHPCDTLLA